VNEKERQPTIGDDQWQAVLKGHEAQKAKMPGDFQAARRSSSRHRGFVEQSDLCGCFYCIQVFPPSEIRVGADSDGVTAICPKCGIDPVLPGAAGFPLSRAFLSNMNRHWF
jgi:hypothetical protein